MPEETPPNQSSGFAGLREVLETGRERVESSPLGQYQNARSAERRGEEAPAPVPVIAPPMPFQEQANRAIEVQEKTAPVLRSASAGRPQTPRTTPRTSTTTPTSRPTAIRADYGASDSPPINWSPGDVEVERLVSTGLLGRGESEDLSLVWQAGRADSTDQSSAFYGENAVTSLMADMHRGESAVQDQMMSEVTISRFPGVSAVNTFAMNERARTLWRAKIEEEMGLEDQILSPEQRVEIHEEAELRAARTMTRVMQSGGRLLWTDPLDHDITEDLMNSGLIGTAFRPIRALLSPVRFGAMGAGRSNTAVGRTSQSLSRGQLKYESSLSLVGRMAPSTIVAAAVATGSSPWSRESTEAIRAGEDIILHVGDIAEALGGEDPGLVAKGVAATLVLGVILFEPDILSLSLGGVGLVGKAGRLGMAAAKISRVANAAGGISDSLRMGNITIRQAATQLEALDPAFFRAVELAAGARLNVSGATVTPEIHRMFKKSGELREEARVLRAQAEEAQGKWERFVAGEGPDFNVSQSGTFYGNVLAREGAEADHAASLLARDAAEANKNAFLEAIGFSPEDAVSLRTSSKLPVDENAARFQERAANQLETRAAEVKKANHAAFQSYEKASTALADLLAGLQRLRGPHKGMSSRQLTVTEGRHGVIRSTSEANHPTIGQQITYRTERGGWARGIVDDIVVRGIGDTRFPRKHPAKAARDGLYEIHIQVRGKGGGAIRVQHPLQITHGEGRAINVARTKFLEMHKILFEPGGPYTKFRVFTDAADDARAIAKSLRKGGEASLPLSMYERAAKKAKRTEAALKEVTKSTKGNMKQEKELLSKWGDFERKAATKEGTAAHASGLRTNYAGVISELVESTRAFRSEGLERLGLDNPTLKAFLTSKKPWKAVSKLTAEQITKFGHLATDASVEASFREVMTARVRLNPETRMAEVDVAGMAQDLERIIGKVELEGFLEMPQFSAFKKLLDDAADETIVRDAKGGGILPNGRPLGFSISSTRIVNGIEKHSGDTPRLIDFLVNHVEDPDYRLLLERIKPILVQDLPVRVLPIKDLGGASGKYKAKVSSRMGGEKITNWEEVLLANVKSRPSGIDAETIVHELVHAATTRRLAAARLNRNLTSELGRARAELKSLQKNPKVSKPLAENYGEVYVFDRPAPSYNALDVVDDLEEFVAYGLTNREFQDVLRAIKLEGGESAWSAFVTAIRKLLGIPPGETNALSELLRISDDVMAAPLHDLPFKGFLGRLPGQSPPPKARRAPGSPWSSDTQSVLLRGLEREQQELEQRILELTKPGRAELSRDPWALLGDYVEAKRGHIQKRNTSFKELRRQFESDWIKIFGKENALPPRGAKARREAGGAPRPELKLTPEKKAGELKPSPKAAEDDEGVLTPSVEAMEPSYSPAVVKLGRREEGYLRKILGEVDKRWPQSPEPRSAAINAVQRYIEGVGKISEDLYGTPAAYDKLLDLRARFTLEIAVSGKGKPFEGWPKLTRPAEPKPTRPELTLTPPEYTPKAPRGAPPKSAPEPEPTLPGQGAFDFGPPKGGDDPPPPRGGGDDLPPPESPDGRMEVPYSQWGEVAQEVRTLISFGERAKIFTKTSAWGRAIHEAQRDLNLRSTKRGDTWKHPLWIKDALRRKMRKFTGAFDNVGTRVGEVSPELESALVETERIFSRAQMELAEIVSVKELGDTPTERMINFLDRSTPIPMKEGLSRWGIATGNGSPYQKMKMQILADSRLDPLRAETRKFEIESKREMLEGKIGEMRKSLGDADGLRPGELDDLLEGLSDDLLSLVGKGEKISDGIPKALSALSRAWMKSSPEKNILPEAGIILAGITRGALIKAETYEEFSDLVRRGTYSILAGTTSNVAKAHSMSASAAMLSASLGEFSHRIDSVMMAKIGAQEAIDINRVLMGDFAKVQDVDVALEALNKLGMPLTQAEIKTFGGIRNDISEMGKVQKTMITLGTREGGTSMVPRALIEQIERRAGNIVKELDALHLVARVGQPIDKALATYMSVWRGSAVTGLGMPNPRYWTNNIFGDFSQMWIEEGAGFAAKRSFINAPSNLPWYGRKLHEKSLYMAERVGGKSGTKEALPGMIETMINPWLGRVFKGEKGEFVTASGDVISYDMLRKWSLEDGISETFIREELYQMYDRVGKTWGGDTYKWWQKQIADHASLGQERQRVGMYADLIQKGVPRADAAKRTKMALYDWSHGIAEWESRYIARNIPFWRFWRLAQKQLLDATMQPLVLPTGELFKKAMLGNTKLARLRQQLHILPSLPEFIYQENIDVGITTEEKVNLIATQLYPNWMETRARLGVLPMDPIRRQWWSETYGRTYTHSATLLPTLTALDSFDMMVGLTSGLGYVLAQISEKMGGPRFGMAGDHAARFFEPVLGSMNPLYEPQLRAALDKAGVDLDYSAEGDFRYLSPTDEEVWFNTLKKIPYFDSQMQFDRERGQWKIPSGLYTMYRALPILSTQVGGWASAIQNPEWQRGNTEGTLMMLRKLTRFGDSKPFDIAQSLNGRMRDIEQEFREFEGEMGDVNELRTHGRTRGRTDRD